MNTVDPKNAVILRPHQTDWLHRLRDKQNTLPAATMPLRLLFVSTSSGEGGIERHSVCLAEHLAKHGASVTYACHPGRILQRLCRAKKIETEPLETHNSGDLLSAFRLAGMILRHGSTVVHVHSRRDFVAAVLAVSFARCVKMLTQGIPTAPGTRPRRVSSLPVLVLHAHLLKKLGAPNWLSGRFFESGAHAIFAVSDAARNYLLAVHCLRPDFVSVIYNGIDLSRYEMPPQKRRRCREEMRRRWNIPDSALVVGMVGRLGTKGQDQLLNAAPCILAHFVTVYFVFVGPEGEAGARLVLEQAADTARITAQVVFTGPSENVPALLPGMDIFVHLPEEEAFGLALVEAMAAGLPVIATDVGGCREVVEDGVTGLLIKGKDEIVLSEALLFLLDPGSSALRQRMGNAGKRRARQLFSIQQQVESLEVHYQNLIDHDRYESLPKINHT